MQALELRVFWGTILLDVEHRVSDRPFTIGEARGTDLFIASDGLPTDCFPLLRTIDQTEVLTFTREMSGELEQGDHVSTLDALRGTSLLESDTELDGAYRVRLPRGARGLVRWGGITIAFRFVERPERLPFAPLRDVDLRYVNLLMLAVACHVAIVVTFLTRPYDTASLREDFDVHILDLLPAALATIPTRAQHLPADLHATPEPSVSRPTLQRTRVRGVAPGSVATKLDALLGRFSADLTGSRIPSGGLSGALRQAIGSMSHTPGVALAGSDLHGELGGSDTGRGAHRDIGSIASDAGPRHLLDGAHLLGRHREHDPLEIHPPVVSDGLDSSLVRKVVNANRAQVRYCYEVELQRDQDLAGRVVMRWTIGATGAVVLAQVVESTMATPRVAACLRDKINQWRFPQPAGGGTVTVNYPFVFRSN